MTSPVEIEVYVLSKVSPQMKAAHPKVSHYALAHWLPVEDFVSLGGAVVKIDGKHYQVLGLNPKGDKTEMALRLMLKVGRG